MKMDVIFTEEMLYDMLNEVRTLQDKLYQLNFRLNMLEDNLEDLEYEDNLEKFNKDERGFGLKLDVLRIGTEFTRFCDQREQILKELKETYKRVFLRESDPDNERTIQSENRFMLGQV